MKPKIETQTIPLGGLAQLFDQKEERLCIFLIDQVGNSFTFFKYKAKLIDISSQIIAVAINKKSKQEAIQGIRKAFTYGIKQGQNIAFHIGDSPYDDVNKFLSGASFWQPKKLFQPPGKLDQDWYRSKLMKPTDKDFFGNEGTLYPSDTYRIFISTSKEVQYSDINWLKGTEESFKVYKIK